MAKPEFYRTKTGVGYIKLMWLDLVRYSGMIAPICDFCASPCPYEDKRNNPLWWLSQESEGTQHA